MHSNFDRSAAKIATALRARGFLINIKDGEVSLAKGSHPKDINDLKELLNNCHIKHVHRDNSFLILNEIVEDSAIQKIIWYPARNVEAGGVGYRSWKYFIKRKYGPQVRTILLETGVALLVKALSASGVTTICSCDGHGKRTPFLSFNGHYNAAWFMVLYNTHLKNHRLNYQWKINDSDDVDLSISPINKGGNWNIKLILEDTLLMADFFLEYSEELSLAKRQIFGTNRNSTAKLLKEKTFAEKVYWMNKRYSVFLEENSQIYLKES